MFSFHPQYFAILTLQCVILSKINFSALMIILSWPYVSVTKPNKDGWGWNNRSAPFNTAMALFRRSGVAQAFRNNRQLQQFVLTGVTPTGRMLGTGSYGSVEEVSVELLRTLGGTTPIYFHR